MAAESHPTIATERRIQVRPELVHALLVDIEAWPVWSPHIASAEPSTGRVRTGSRVLVRPWFSPTASEMRVTWEAPGEGMDWESFGLGHALRYRQRIEPEGDGARVRFEARVEGRLGALLTRLARPLSAYGQRRRITRLARLAELMARGAD